MKRIKSADGTTIAFEKTGSGPALILASGALTDRVYMRPLAEALSERLTVINFDRRGRGDSGDSGDSVDGGDGVVSTDREIEDISALMEVAGEGASLYGHSSGACLAFRTAASGLPFERLILHEPPFSIGEEEKVASKRFADELAVILAGEGEGQGREALELFLSATGMPDESIDAMKVSPEWESWVKLGTSLAWDSAAMNDDEGGVIPYEILNRITMPTVLLEGSGSGSQMFNVGVELASKLPDGIMKVLEGAGHEASPESIAPAVFEFMGLSGPTETKSSVLLPLSVFRGARA